MVFEFCNLTHHLSECFDGNVRVVGGSSPYEGIVEVCHGGNYGTICDEGWDDVDASVACRRAGFFGKCSFVVG